MSYSAEVANQRNHDVCGTTTMVTVQSRSNAAQWVLSADNRLEACERPDGGNSR